MRDLINISRLPGRPMKPVSLREAEEHARQEQEMLDSMKDNATVPGMSGTGLSGLSPEMMAAQAVKAQVMKPINATADVMAGLGAFGQQASENLIDPNQAGIFGAASGAMSGLATGGLKGLLTGGIGGGLKSWFGAMQREEQQVTDAFMDDISLTDTFKDRSMFAKRGGAIQTSGINRAYIGIAVAPVQAEEGEAFTLPDGTVFDVAAKLKHTEQKKNDITDYLPEEGYVFSAQYKLKRKDAESIPLSEDVPVYTEDGKPKNEVKITFMDKLFREKEDEVSFADLALRVRKMYPLIKSGEGDPFAEHAKKWNLESRKVILGIIVALNEERRMKDEIKDTKNALQQQVTGELEEEAMYQEMDRLVSGNEEVSPDDVEVDEEEEMIVPEEMPEEDIEEEEEEEYEDEDEVPMFGRGGFVMQMARGGIIDKWKKNLEKRRRRKDKIIEPIETRKPGEDYGSRNSRFWEKYNRDKKIGDKFDTEIERQRKELPNYEDELYQAEFDYANGIDSEAEYNKRVKEINERKKAEDDTKQKRVDDLYNEAKEISDESKGTYVGEIIKDKDGNTITIKDKRIKPPYFNDPINPEDKTPDEVIRDKDRESAEAFPDNQYPDYLPPLPKKSTPLPRKSNDPRDRVPGVYKRKVVPGIYDDKEYDPSAPPAVDGRVKKEGAEPDKKWWEKMIDKRLGNDPESKLNQLLTTGIDQAYRKKSRFADAAAVTGVMGAMSQKSAPYIPGDRTFIDELPDSVPQYLKDQGVHANTLAYHNAAESVKHLPAAMQERYLSKFKDSMFTANSNAAVEFANKDLSLAMNKTSALNDFTNREVLRRERYLDDKQSLDNFKKANISKIMADSLNTKGADAIGKLQGKIEGYNALMSLKENAKLQALYAKMMIEKPGTVINTTGTTTLNPTAEVKPDADAAADKAGTDGAGSGDVTKGDVTIKDDGKGGVDITVASQLYPIPPVPEFGGKKIPDFKLPKLPDFKVKPSKQIISPDQMFDVQKLENDFPVIPEYNFDDFNKYPLNKEMKDGGYVKPNSVRKAKQFSLFGAQHADESTDLLNMRMDYENAAREYQRLRNEMNADPSLANKNRYKLMEVTGQITQLATAFKNHKDNPMVEAEVYVNNVNQLKKKKK